MINKKRGNIIIIRHGPTHGEEICIKELNNIIGNIINCINDNCTTEIHKIYTSPYDRCKITTKYLMDGLNIKKRRTCHQLSRKENFDTWTDVHERGYNYGKFIRKKYKNSEKNIIIVTHSSILIDIIKGILKIKNSDRESIYIHPCSLTIINDTDIKEFNKHWSSHQ